jgi:hypothetical protein
MAYSTYIEAQFLKTAKNPPNRACRGTERELRVEAGLE